MPSSHFQLGNSSQSEKIFRFHIVKHSAAVHTSISKIVLLQQLASPVGPSHATAQTVRFPLIFFFLLASAFEAVMLLHYYWFSCHALTCS